MGSPWLPWWTLNTVMYVFIKRRQRKINYTERRKKHKAGAERGLKMLALMIGVMCHKPRTSISHQKLEEARGRFSSTTFRRSVPQLTTWFWPSVIDFRLQDSLMAKTVKNPPAVWETWIWSLCWEDPLEKGMAIHSNILAWRMSMDRGAWQATVHGVAKSQIWLSNLSTAQLSKVWQCKFLSF